MMIQFHISSFHFTTQIYSSLDFSLKKWVISKNNPFFSLSTHIPEKRYLSLLNNENIINFNNHSLGQMMIKIPLENIQALLEPKNYKAVLLIFKQCFLYFEKHDMGNNNTFAGSCSPKEQFFPTSSNHSAFSASLHNKRPLSLSAVRLSHFRSTLQKPQCFYVLNTLLQQYYSLYTEYGKVVVSDQLCHVTKFGEVKVDFCIDGPETPLSLYNQVTHSFVTIVAQILETVGGLAIEKSWLGSTECAYFQEKITNLIYQFHSNQDRLYHELLHQINLFMQTSHITCNLIAALLRLNQPLSHQPLPAQSLYHGETPYLALSRCHSSSQLRSQVEYQGISRYSIADQEQFSTIHKLKDNSTKVDSHEEHNQLSGLRKHRKSTYRHKMARTEGESFFNHLQSNQNLLRNRQTFLSQAPPTTERPPSKEESSYHAQNHISAQYSIHIFNAFAKNKSSKTSQKVKFHPNFSKSNSSCRQNDSDERDWRKKTSIQDLGSGQFKTEKNSRVYTKSVLDELARSVEVRDQPSSRSYIF